MNNRKLHCKHLLTNIFMLINSKYSLYSTTSNCQPISFAIKQFTLTLGCKEKTKQLTYPVHMPPEHAGKVLLHSTNRLPRHSPLAASAYNLTTV